MQNLMDEGQGSELAPDGTLNTEKEKVSPVQSSTSPPGLIFLHLTDSVLERFGEKTDKSGGPEDCWHLSVAHTNGGYPRFHLSAKLGERPLCANVA